MRFVPTDFAPDEDAVGSARRAPAEDVRLGGAFFGDLLQRRRISVIGHADGKSRPVARPVGAASVDRRGCTGRPSIGGGGAGGDAGSGVCSTPADRDRVVVPAVEVGSAREPCSKAGWRYAVDLE